LGLVASAADRRQVSAESPLLNLRAARPAPQNGRNLRMFSTVVSPELFSAVVGDFTSSGWSHAIFWLLCLLVATLIACWLALRYIPNDSVGIVEKLWSASGSVPEGRMIALDGQAGYQAELLRGGIHFGLWRWQYRVHTARLV